MVKRPLLALFVCLALLITAYDASAQEQQTGAATNGATSVKNAKAKPKPTSASKKETAKAPEKPGVVGSAKKASKKQEIQGSDAKSNAAKGKASKSRKQRKSSRDPASLPVVHEEFAETPHVVLAELSTVPTEGEISSYFGIRRVATKTRRARMHTGVDIRAGQGSPVLAAAAGVVCFVGDWAGYGKIVEIDHDNGLITRYAHLSSYAVAVGATVISGEQVGTVGRTGRATGSHLHFETLVNGRHVDPMMAEMWAQGPDRLMAKRGVYVSGLRSSDKTVH
jgi:murein DD-endopeptidase MepM/ murein hydrolase activator NlpD